MGIFVHSLEMAAKVVCFASVGRAPWPVLSRLLRRPELQAAQGLHQPRFVRAGKHVRSLHDNNTH